MQLYIFILRHFTCFKLSMIASTQTMSRKQNSGRPSWNFYKVFGQRKCQSVHEIFKYSLIRFVQSFISLRTSYHTSNMRLNLLDRPIKKFLSLFVTPSSKVIKWRPHLENLTHKILVLRSILPSLVRMRTHPKRQI